ncbi:hypothetical protein AUJ14_03290 [Candidatus Micrarchaeota archaeon CG1_02_55_22]|nr:MAG: hypothetical protein AUJ14_03290 [Candidatus Micrarchaeota archaeon CG1_02_55_22]
MIRIAPSMLAANQDDLIGEARKAQDAGAELLQLDVGDGEFIPTKVFDAKKASLVASSADIPVEAHLMVARPMEFVSDYADAGVKRIIVHAESSAPLEALREAKKRGCEAGLAIKLETNLEDVPSELLDEASFFVVMAVPVGRAGQSFNASALDKIRVLAKTNKEVEADGGINPETAKLCRGAGASTLVTGSFFFNAGDGRKALESLRG